MLIRKAGAALATAALLASTSLGAFELIETREIAWSTMYGNVLWPSGEFVARTAESWKDAWGRADYQYGAERRYSKPAAPAVDFGANMVVGVSRGIGPNGCHGLSIRGVVEYPDAIEVRYGHFAGNGGNVKGGGFGVCTSSLVPLQDIVEIPQSSKPVRFRQVGRS